MAERAMVILPIFMYKDSFAPYTLLTAYVCIFYQGTLNTSYYLA